MIDHYREAKWTDFMYLALVHFYSKCMNFVHTGTLQILVHKSMITYRDADQSCRLDIWLNTPGIIKEGMI